MATEESLPEDSGHVLELEFERFLSDPSLFLSELRDKSNWNESREALSDLIRVLKYKSEKPPVVEVDGMRLDILIGYLEQSLESYTRKRSEYYLDRILKSLAGPKVGKLNDIDMNRWKEYEEVITDSLWIMDKRDREGAHNADYWGNFIPQIPHQLMLRFTKKGEWILDTYAGSGTSLIESIRLGRNAIGIDLSQEACNLADKNLRKEDNRENAIAKVVCGDSSRISFPEILRKEGIESVQLVIMHPPYWDIIKFSEDNSDLSNSPSIDVFLSRVQDTAKEAMKVLEKGRYLALVIGDKYSNGEWIPLGFRSMDAILKLGFKLKSTIVKNFDMTKGKKSQKELWRYRALAGGFYIFKHEYIFLFQK